MGQTKKVTDENKSIVYFINEDKRTVVAVLDNLQESLIPSITKDIAKAGIGANVDNVAYGLLPLLRQAGKASLLPDRVTAKAVCSESDPWDVEFGKQLAKARLLKTAVRYKFNFMMNFMDILGKIQNQIGTRLDMYDGLYQTYEAQIDDLYLLGNNE